MRGGMVTAVLVFAVAVATSASAATPPEFKLLLRDHKFEPAALKVPANTQFKVLVTNQNAMPSEFESSDFNREKIVLPNSTITVFIGPLKPGSYKFFDDFHQATTGVLIVE